MKKSNGSATATDVQTNALVGTARTATVVPRTNKLKVSGGTQTNGNDLQQSELNKIFITPRFVSEITFFYTFLESMQYKSYSLTGSGAAQLSQSVKDRFASGKTNSLPKSGLEMHVFHARLDFFTCFLGLVPCLFI